MRVMDGWLGASDEGRVDAEWLVVAALGGFALGVAAAYVFSRPAKVGTLPRHAAVVPSSRVEPGLAQAVSGNDRPPASVAEEAGSESSEA